MILPGIKVRKKRGAYLRAYNGGRFTIDRIGRGSFAANSWSVCLIGGIQPEPIQRIATQAVDDGILQRMMLDVPPPQGIGKDQPPDRNALNAYQDIFPALAALRPVRTGLGHPTTVALHADAHAAREDVDTLARVMGAMPDTSPRLQSTFGERLWEEIGRRHKAGLRRETLVMAGQTVGGIQEILPVSKIMRRLIAETATALAAGARTISS